MSIRRSEGFEHYKGLSRDECVTVAEVLVKLQAQNRVPYPEGLTDDELDDLDELFEDIDRKRYNLQFRQGELIPTDPVSAEHFRSLVEERDEELYNIFKRIPDGDYYAEGPFFHKAKEEKKETEEVEESPLRNLIRRADLTLSYKLLPNKLLPYYDTKNGYEIIIRPIKK